MGSQDRGAFKYSWEEAIAVLRADPAHQDLIFHSYLSADLAENARRFSASAEFAETLRLLAQKVPRARAILDIPGGNGIAAYAFAKAGFEVTTVEPDPSASVGRGAIAAALASGALKADIVDAFGENLPFADASFDVVYVRQGLHHAADLPKMVREYARVLRPGGVLFAGREHVVENYGESLEAFLATQADHQLYGGEHAFTLPDYRAALGGAGLNLVLELGPFDSCINLYPASIQDLHRSLLASRKGRYLARLLPAAWVANLGLWWLRRQKMPGRLYTFLAAKPGGAP